ncbi:MAG TPA: TPM domain-containing protein, partial [Anaeromyxobacteraceae bacterium]|nr:TPM domain-containing protein [Anaeromyxobacteraceae bacterium]
MRAALVAALLAAALPAAAQVPIPPLAGPVVDAAGALDAGAVRRLEALSRAAHGQGGQGVQLQYLVVGTLEGEPIEDYAIRVAEAWKLGTAKEDNGVLVVVAMEERAVRIEVGNGIEGGLTDVQASRIIRNTIVPAFRARRYGDGLYEAGVQLLSALGALPQGVAGPARRPAPQVHLGSTAILVFFVLVFLLRGLFGMGRRRRRVWWGGGPWIGGGGFGGFGGGGGGF